jgi:20S proteasome subunit beta 2
MTSIRSQHDEDGGSSTKTTAFGTELVTRNELLKQKAGIVPSFTKTGTTIVGLIYKDGVVLGADTRSTAGTTVADKNCEKIHYIAPNIYCCGAGTAADTENVTGMISSQLELHRYATGRQSRVNSAMTLLKSHLFKYQGYISAALVLGGVDCKGPQLFTIYPHGSTDSLPYCTMGSGSLNAMSVFESGYKDGLTREEGIDLVTRAIRAGVYNDLGSGSNVDVCVITKDNVEYLRNHEYLQGKTYRRQHEKVIPLGTTTVLRERVSSLVAVQDIAPEAMEIM